MKIVDGIDMEKVKAGELKEMIVAFNKAKVGAQIKPGANPLGSVKAFVKAVEALDEDKQAMLPDEVQEYYNLIVVDDEELSKRQGPVADEKPGKTKPAAKPPAEKPSPPAKPPQAAKKPPASKPAPKPKEDVPVQNGIRQPKPGSLCGQAWSIFDSLSKRKKGATPAIADCLKVAEDKGLNPGNVRAEYPRWKKFNAI